VNISRDFTLAIGKPVVFLSMRRSISSIQCVSGTAAIRREENSLAQGQARGARKGARNG